MTAGRVAPELAERFPPLVTPVRLREHEDAFAEAMRRAPDLGAGTLLHVGRFDPIEFALVLEPEEPLASARRVVFAGMNALADTILADCPPERVVTFDFPGSLTFDAGLIGGGRLGWPAGTAEDEVPEWLVFGTMLRVGGFQELGFTLSPKVTSLEEAGYSEIDPVAFAARFCRHFMVEIDEWQEEGFEGVARRYLDRLPKGEGERLRGLGGNGDLLVHLTAGGAARPRSLAEALVAPSWFDAATGAPRA